MDAPTPAIVPHEHTTNVILRDVGRRITLDLVKEVSRSPPQIGEFVTPFRTLPCVLDMHIKPSDSDTVVMPADFSCLLPLLQQVYAYERAVNPECLQWHMWLLVDTRPVLPCSTQRNPGFHYDGCALGGLHPHKRVTSIYSWTNTLPTIFYTGPVEFPPNFCGKRDNASLVLQQQPKSTSQIMVSKPNAVYRFDGMTPHAGAYSKTRIDNRIFVRVCFTPPEIVFNRAGNTHNPYLSAYWNTWHMRGDPGSTLSHHKLQFWGSTEQQARQFSNLWQVACLGHPSFGMQELSECSKQGTHPLQQKMVDWLKTHRGAVFLKKVMNLLTGDQHDPVGEMRARILSLYIDNY